MALTPVSGRIVLRHGWPVRETPSPGNITCGGATLEDKLLGAARRSDSPPTLKIASNTALAERKPRWIDFDAGAVLTPAGLDSAGEALIALVLATASGQTTCAERNGERGIALWKRGVTL